ncbi:MAG: LCP family protein [Candidatus Melainabacteria bacterium]|nr:LCP family protein [Candidatus Melainabacteria bacterium]
MKLIKPALIAFSSIVLLGSIYFFFIGDRYSSVEPLEKIYSSDRPQLEEELNILILGADSLVPGKLEGWNGRSDVIVLLNFNPRTKQVSILSIPRDTHIELKKYPDIHRINSANQFGGYKLSKRAVRRLLDKVKIDHVIVFSMKSTIELLETLGPLKIFVPVDMKYRDKSAGLDIDIKAGLQELEGKELMNFLRFRNLNKGDIGRIERQHIFFRAALKKLSQPEMIFRLPGILLKAGRTFTTDMSFRELFELGTLLRSLLPGSEQEQDNVWDFQSYIVPGDFGEDGSWVPNHSKIKVMMQEIRRK